MKMNSLVIFDFDDTIVDNNKLDYMGFKIPCKTLGLNFPSKSKLKKYRKKGMLAKEIIKIFSKDNQKLNEFLRLRKNFLIKESYNYLKVKPYSKSLFQKLRKSNFELVICTANNNTKMIHKFLRRHNLDHFFKQIFTIDNLGINLENNNYPNRILIKTSLMRFVSKKYTNSEKDCIFIGNSLEDYYASKKLKIKFIYFLNSYLPIPRIDNLSKVSTMNQIFNIIQGEKI